MCQNPGSVQGSVQCLRMRTGVCGPWGRLSDHSGIDIGGLERKMKKAGKSLAKARSENVPFL